MIVSGGENVYCKEVEDLLFDHDDVLEAAIFGLPDPTVTFELWLRAAEADRAVASGVVSG